MLRTYSFVLMSVVAATACSKKGDESSLAVPSASASASPTAPAVVWTLNIDPKSTAHIDMPGPKQHIQGDASAAMGSLVVTPTDLGQSRGSVIIDLSTLTTHTFDNADDAKQTRETGAWLESLVGGKPNEIFRYATFAIQSVDGLSATDLTKVAPTKQEGHDVRTVTMTVHGDVLIHGHKEPRAAVVDVAFHQAAGAPVDAKPLRVDITSKEPLRLELKELDVRPRGPGAHPLADVAPSADVTVSLHATAKP